MANDRRKPPDECDLKATMRELNDVQAEFERMAKRIKALQDKIARLAEPLPARRRR